ncbi:MAG: hypothetical protein ACFFD5_17215, partial [Candidatus Thorarchaeota archaeon]
EKRDFKTVETQLDKLGSTTENIIHKINLLYYKNEKNKLVDLTVKFIDDIVAKLPNNYDVALLMAAECANDLLRISERDQLLEKIKNLKDSRGILALYKFISRSKKNILEIRSAIDDLYNEFENGCSNIRVLTNLFDYLESNEEDQAKKLIKIIEGISKHRAFSEKEIIKICEANFILKKYEKVLKDISDAIERFGEKVELLSLKAHALDESGNTPEALKILEKMVESECYDESALELYSQIASRFGLFKKALQNVLTLYERQMTVKNRKHLLRLTFILEMAINPISLKLIEYCEKYGEINNQDDKAEEGIYLQFFFFATLNKKVKTTDDQLNKFQRRLTKYIEKYPDSEFIRAIKLDKKTSSKELIKILDDLYGLDEERKRWFKNNEVLLDRNLIPIPFIMRPKVLINVHDPFYLWELSKTVSDKWKRYQIPISRSMYKLRDKNKYLKRTPLIDEVTLLILNDLGLLDKVLQIFSQIAITKSTLMRFQNNVIYLFQVIKLEKY